MAWLEIVSGQVSCTCCKKQFLYGIIVRFLKYNSYKAKLHYIPCSLLATAMAVMSLHLPLAWNPHWSANNNKKKFPQLLWYISGQQQEDSIYHTCSLAWSGNKDGKKDYTVFLLLFFFFFLWSKFARVDNYYIKILAIHLQLFVTSQKKKKNWETKRVQAYNRF